MAELAGLRLGPNRSGVDAYYDFVAGGSPYATPIELKSTTSKSVSTARDVGLSHVEKWRSRVWIFGFYDPSGDQLESLLVLGPRDMEPWISQIEHYIAPDMRIGERSARRLELDDLYIICGEKHVYSLEDAQSLHKRQWNLDRYVREQDRADGYSAGKMLEILKLRALYLNARGSTLNNPHIPSTFWPEFGDRMVSPRGAKPRLRRTMRAAIRSITLEDPQLRRLARESVRP